LNHPLYSILNTTDPWVERGLRKTGQLWIQVL
jgi:hypothetical protein